MAQILTLNHFVLLQQNLVPERDAFSEPPVTYTVFPCTLSSVRTESNEARVGICFTTQYLDYTASNGMMIDE
jgi:hypothetical protein